MIKLTAQPIELIVKRGDRELVYPWGLAVPVKSW
jgi:hypothetical protein